ncbi:hypothetical protein ANCCAN_27391 [Ancylostoma caninum]|uniref:Uncharacterized protein n=1 Tax=Ancylostoma caninum TaxID=29170 RepID=A0A368F438_ANCCA|nr:hypothetical protein ANCCAN_27391 [Ancylostoma caninum]
MCKTLEDVNMRESSDEDEEVQQVEPELICYRSWTL